MADPWNATTAYGPGSIVTYKGLTYYRSEFPNSATAGTPPSDEMGTDPLGDAIRTWTLWYTTLDLTNLRNRLIPRYFRLVNDWDATTKTQVYYQGMTKYARSAYDDSGLQDFSVGYTAEMDQSGAGFGTVSADKCGVALQQWQETDWTPFVTTPPDVGIYAQVYVKHDLIFQGGNWIEDPTATEPYTWYVFLLFNHPLYFRRNIELAYSWTDNNVSPSVTDIVTHDVIPTDANYCLGDFPNNGTQSYFQPSNAVWTFQLPTATDTLGSVWVKDVESND